MIRFEILLPLFYNDGRAIEDHKFIETDDELVKGFGATSTDSVAVHGHWLYQSTIYEDRLIRVRLDLDDSAENWQGCATSKKTQAAIRADRHLDSAHRIEISNGIS